MSGTTEAPPARAASRRVLHDIDWRDAVGAVAWIPPEHRNPVVPASTAMRMLRCTDRSFAQLQELGLPATAGPDGPLFDPIDLKNVGLYSGSGVTDVEVAMRFLLRYMNASVEDLTRPRRWRFQLRLTAPRPPAEPAPRRLHPPTPEAFGGELHALGGETDGDGFLVIPQGGDVAGALTTRGAHDPVRSPAIRAAMRDLTESGLRWQYLPTSLELRPDDAVGMGVGNCAVLCSVLERRLVAEGYDAKAYHGWMVEVPYVEHGWVEVVDEDGGTKCLDPSFALLATKNGFGTPEFEDFVVGSRLNRVVPTRARLNHPFVLDAGPDETAVLLGQPDGTPATAEPPVSGR